MRIWNEFVTKQIAFSGNLKLNMFKELPNEVQQQVEFYLQANQFRKAKELIADYRIQSIPEEE